jgi:hypothetical protein
MTPVKDNKDDGQGSGDLSPDLASASIDHRRNVIAPAHIEDGHTTIPQAASRPFCMLDHQRLTAEIGLDDSGEITVCLPKAA